MQKFNINPEVIYQPDHILDLLSQDSFLATCYARSAGVSEGYTILEHTRLVLKTAHHYRHTLEPMLGSLLTWPQYMIFLALHDIGKGAAKQATANDPLGSSLSVKYLELSNTREILQRFLPQLQLNPTEINLCLGLLQHDTIGTLLKSEISVDEAIDNCQEIAVNLRLNPESFAQLFTAFHMTDAASYPSLSQFFVTDEGVLRYCDQYQLKMTTLHDALANIRLGSINFQLYVTQAHKILSMLEITSNDSLLLNVVANLDSLIAFLEESNRQLLTCTSLNTQENEQYFKGIKKGFRDILLAICKTNMNHDELTQFVESYHNARHSELGNSKFIYNEDWDSVSGVSFSSLGIVNACKQLSIDVDTHVRRKFEVFFDELIAFRKNVQTRYSRSKILPEKLSKSCQLTWLHGSKSSIWPNLHMTVNQLLPTGRLTKLKITPMCGELKGGVAVSGINEYCLSGTGLEDANRAWTYAMNPEFEISPDAVIKKIMQFLNTVESYYSKRYSYYQTSSDMGKHLHYGQYIIAIRQFRVIDPNGFVALQPRILNAVQFCTSSWQAYKESTDYLKYMPKADDPTGQLGYRWHDTYYKRWSIKTDETYLRIQEAMVCDLAIPHQLAEQLQQAYPMLFASRTLRAPLAMSNKNSERKTIKAAEIGKDIQTIFVKPEDSERLQDYLKAHGLSEKVKVKSIQKAVIAMRQFKEASPYFSDIYSEKKLVALLKQIDNGSEKEIGCHNTYLK